MQTREEQNKVLESQQVTVEKRRTTYEDVTLRVQTLWEGLCDDMRHIAQQAVDELVR
jgi:hypothetical protein